MKLVKLLFFLTCLSLPLYVVRCKNFALCENFSPLPFTFLEVLILLTFTAWFWWKYTDIKKGNETPSRLLQRLRTPLMIPFSFFLFSGIISTFVAVDTKGALGILKAYFIEGFLFYLVAVDFLKVTSQVRFVLFSMASSAVWISAFALLQAFLDINPFAPQELVRGRVSAVYSSSNAVGLLVAPLFAFVFGWFILEYKERRKEKLWLILSGCLVLMAGGIFVSGSRGAILGLGFGGLFYLSFFLSQMNQFLKRNFSTIFLLVSLLFLACWLVLLANIAHFVPEKPSNNTLLSRTCLWEGAKNLLLERPIIGSGLNDFRETQVPYRTCSLESYQYPHNIILNFWTQTGLLGVVSFFWLSVFLVVSLLRVKKMTLLSISLVAGLVTLFGHGLVDVPFFKNDLSVQFWLFLALGSYLITVKGRRRSFQSDSSFLNN